MSLQFALSFANHLAPALADHLWQSTVFGVAAAALTLALRKNSARLRYFIWLAASLKFWLPFSLLVALGRQFAWRHSPASPTSGLYIIQVAGQPFTRPLPITATSAPAPAGSLPLLLPILLGVWLCGFLAVLFIWIARWWRISAALRKSAPLTDGREFSTLRRLEGVARIVRPMKILFSGASLEPGIFGIIRPVLLWPGSISEHLDDSHIEAVIAHELCHVRRRDNLWAALHMLVQAIFWFHPLVWWIGARLIAERELACDEAVLELGSQRHTYAESILKVCEFCLSSPLTCVSGVTGSDLKKRMVHIMNDHVVRKLSFVRRILLWTAAGLAIALPVAFGLLNATPSRAESAVGTAPKYVDVSVKPHPEDLNGPNMTRVMISLKDASFMARGVSVQSLVQLAYRVQDSQLAQAPEWLDSAKYDVDAKVDNAAADAWGKLTEDQRGTVSRQMLQTLLADQFKLKVHQEAQDLPAYVLTVADGGGKLTKEPDGTHGMMQLGMGELTSRGTPLDLLTSQLSLRLGRPVVDKTGLAGKYAYSLHWTPDADERARMQQKEPIASDSPASNEAGPSLLTAIQEQLGLTLQPVTTRVQVLVIDHVEQPSASQ